VCVGLALDAFCVAIRQGCMLAVQLASFVTIVTKGRDPVLAGQ
jgi:hypothetical protein